MPLISAMPLICGHAFGHFPFLAMLLISSMPLIFAHTFCCFTFMAVPLPFGHAFDIWLHLYILALPLVAIFLFGRIISGCTFTLNSFGHFPFLAMPLLYGCAFNFHHAFTFWPCCK